MNQYIRYIGAILIATVSLIPPGCKEFIELEQPKTLLVSAQVFSDEKTATAALANIYAKFSAAGFAAGDLNSITALMSVSADELDNYNTNLDYIEFSQNSVLPKNYYVNGLWTDMYNVIYQSNALIEGLHRSQNLNDQFKNQLTGEALFLKAFTHFYLCNLFGDVPYINTTDYRENTIASRMPIARVMELVIADLKRAKVLLADNYSMASGERVRVNKWTATAMLARVYLYTQDWTNAVTESGLVINNKGLYDLIPVDEVFLKNSKEAIWQLYPVQPYCNTNEGSIFILNSRPMAFALRADLESNFVSGDLRRIHWIAEIKVGTAHWFYPFKYKIRLGREPLNEYSMVLRLAEQYLIRAEAATRLDDLGLAIADVDAVRFRAGLAKIAEVDPDISKGELLREIEAQRRLELFTEWGHRWFDLKRTGRINDVLGSKKTEWISTHAIFPIPASEIRVNPNMVQNPGYN
jgi:hypothetical protein